MRSRALLTCLALLVACGPPRNESWTLHGLDLVPADTPYALVFSTARTHESVSGIMSRLAAGMNTALAQISVELPPAVKASAALFNAFSGEMHPQGKLGKFVPAGGEAALYGLGVYATFRMDVSDSAGMRAAIDRLFADAGLTDAERKPVETGEVTRWTWTDPAGETTIAVTPRELVTVTYPTEAASTILPIALGRKPPRTSLRKSRPNVIPTGDVSARGFVNPPALAAVVTGRDWGNHGEIWKRSHQPKSQACQDEAAMLASQVSGVTVEFRGDTTSDPGLSAVIELEPAVTRSIASLQVDSAIVGEAFPPGSVSITGAAIDAEKLLTLLEGWATKLRAKPLVCEELQFLSSIAEINRADLHPGIAALRSVVQVTDQGILGQPDFAGWLAADTNDVPATLGAINTFFAKLGANLSIPTDGKPIVIVEKPPFGKVLGAATPSRIAFAIGPAASEIITTLLAAAGGKKAPFFVQGIDLSGVPIPGEMQDTVANRLLIISIWPHSKGLEVRVSLPLKTSK